MKILCWVESAKVAIVVGRKEEARRSGTGSSYPLQCIQHSTRFDCSHLSILVTFLLVSTGDHGDVHFANIVTSAQHDTPCALPRRDQRGDDSVLSSYRCTTCRPFLLILKTTVVRHTLPICFPRCERHRVKAACIQCGLAGSHKYGARLQHEDEELEH